MIAPAWRDRMPTARVAAVMGPGAGTPDSEIAVAVRRNLIKLDYSSSGGTLP